MAETNNEVKVEKGSSPITKIILFGIPAFVVQLILVYFITANILMTKVGTQKTTEAGTTEEVKPEGEKSEGNKTGQFIYAIDEIIVNPANTNGRQLLLTSLAFDMPNEVSKSELENKDFLVKDMIISVLSGKSTKFLSNIEQRDSLRNEIETKIENFLPKVKINKVYFSKFILQ